EGRAALAAGHRQIGVDRTFAEAGADYCRSGEKFVGPFAGESAVERIAAIAAGRRAVDGDAVEAGDVGEDGGGAAGRTGGAAAETVTAIAAGGVDIRRHRARMTRIDEGEFGV